MRKDQRKRKKEEKREEERFEGEEGERSLSQHSRSRPSISRSALFSHFDRNDTSNMKDFKNKRYLESTRLEFESVIEDQNDQAWKPLI